MTLDVLERARAALEDDFLRAAVRFTADRLRTKKQAATASLGRWEDWRDRGQQIRAHTVAHLDYYLGQFADHAAKAGGHVQFAADASEASQMVLDIIRAKQARTVVKSKSMVSEEIGINHLLEAAGVEVVETDLGEYIVQLAKETPSHIIIPAIHKNRAQIKDLFTEAGGEGLTTDTKTLAGFARRKLRQKFLEADVGITGCNFGIAESGSVVLFTNEGNADMVVNLPKTHIVLMGMERLVPTFADLEVMANLLPRAATGQNITTYLSMITGTRRPADHDGARELHIIVLDNGRSRQLSDPHMKAVLNCIRCGACLNVCPVYRQIGGHAYGSVYPGPIGAVLSPVLNEGEAYADLPYASSLCGACSEACPVKIPLHDMLVYLRQRNVERGWTKPSERMAFKGFGMTFAKAGRYRLAMKAARIGQGPLVRNGHIEAKIGPLKGWTRGRNAPKLAAVPFRDLWRSLQRDLQSVPSKPGGNGDE
ncbi:iron-sulfur cluster-binding protein [Alicyclobacillus cycloheptanicus]|uniref:L-lactate dehydrogenase complex protein LldF n=1 Tax=Alicyclobacillus cycloheptanicus TaxID=1457 RepID=A0ABT9XH89_9BACL|nr:LutB/LldF family L-lactate oxidation iron-sulfur protein [Alicyclobacillus cycloheptanicus]MDQ0189106.1 L-lactate dehydrogenase complex protein LldF [Alicyclobacillus cycloheptanicus]WDM00236.1 iron-sulfur cluster-binding protein [Alicyclobacillus cycloheptanicus]